MSLRIAAFLLSSALAATSGAAEPTAGPSASPAPVKRIEVIEDAALYLQRTREAQAFAHKGEYGRLSKRQLSELDQAQRTIESLLANRADTSALSNNEQFALRDAQEVINATIRSHDKNRIVCKRIKSTGSRFTTEECLTVAQREERARSIRDGMQKVDAAVCTPGEGQSCAR